MPTYKEMLSNQLGNLLQTVQKELDRVTISSSNIYQMVGSTVGDGLSNEFIHLHNYYP